VIEVSFSLRNEDGTFEDLVRTLPQVPAVGQMVGLNAENHSYQVIDVLWNFWTDGSTSVVVHASELDWHANYAKASDAWDAAHQQ
jgi:hypothetical protein